MPNNVTLTEEELVSFESKGGLAQDALEDQRRASSAFLQFWAENSNAEKLDDCAKTESVWIVTTIMYV